MTTLQSAAKRRNLLHRHLRAWERALLLLRIAALAAATVALWSLVRPEDQLAQLGLGGLVIVVGCVLSWREGKAPTVLSRDLALALEMEYGRGVEAALPAEAETASLSPAWSEVVSRDDRAWQRDERRRLWGIASTLLLPTVIAVAALPHAAPTFKLALREVSRAVASLNGGATLEVLQGAVTEAASKPVHLEASTPETMELLAQNLIEIRVTGAGAQGAAPIVELRRPSSEANKEAKEVKDTKEVKESKPANEAAVFQSFLMAEATAAQGQQAGANANQHVVSFAVSEDVDLYIPAIDATRPLAHVKVRQLPIPKVSLQLASPPEDPWPDDQPLALRIQVHAENPLQSVRLVIKSDQKVSKELVANVMAENKFELTTEYRLLLEPYVENDLAEVEIVAEAVDRSLPTPLVGVSQPLRLTTASAYGRYRQALQTLREVKALTDAAMEKQASGLPAAAAELAEKAVGQSEKSPFFDGMDRMQIHHFASRIHDLAEAPRADAVNELGQALNDFLFEHEILDDRERDRDFFVAARAVSRLLEEDAAKRPAPLSPVLARLRTFLNDRGDRWTKRVARLKPPFVPASWPEIEHKKPFHAALDQIEKLDKKGPEGQGEELTVLSKAVVDYRAWIQDLETQEDKAREQEDRQRQDGLTSARDVLKELQKRQGEISAELDRADERPAEQLADQWPTTRMKQNANTKDTHHLEGQMRSLSQGAAARISAAAQAMEQATEAGNKSDFVNAETNADLAGRLLRQAESAAQQSQQKRRSRGRRRRVTGDNYYGQSVVGGDVEIKREYQVDRRYREDILDEVQSSNYDEENRTLLENYLRHVVR